MSDVGMGLKWQDGTTGSTTHAHAHTRPPSIFHPFQKHSQQLKLWMYTQQRKCCGKRCNAAWLFHGEHNSHQAVQSAAVYRVKGVQPVSNVVTAINSVTVLCKCWGVCDML